MMAGEPETLYSDEPLNERIRRHDYDRLLMLSDGVFAIAITLLALDLVLPAHWDGSVERLMSVPGRPLVGYLFGFGLVGAFWFMHRRLFARLERVDAGVTVLNLLLLGIIGLTPYVARMIAEAGPGRAMPFYLVAIAGVFASIALIRGWAAMRPDLLHPQIDRRGWRSDALAVAASALVFGSVGTWAIVQHQPVDAEVMFLMVVVLAVGRRVVRRRQAQMSSTSRP